MLLIIPEPEVTAPFSFLVLSISALICPAPRKVQVMMRRAFLFTGVCEDQFATLAHRDVRVWALRSIIHVCYRFLLPTSFWDLHGVCRSFCLSISIMETFNFPLNSVLLYPSGLGTSTLISTALPTECNFPLGVLFI